MMFLDVFMIMEYYAHLTALNEVNLCEKQCKHHLSVSLSGVPLETLTVYQTSEHPDLQKNITDYFTQQVFVRDIIFQCNLSVDGQRFQ